MEFVKVWELHESLTVLQARERLFELNKMDYPNMNKDNRRKLFRDIRKQAGYTQKTMTAKEIARMLKDG